MVLARVIQDQHSSDHYEGQVGIGVEITLPCWLDSLQPLFLSSPLDSIFEHYAYMFLTEGFIQNVSSKTIVVTRNALYANDKP